jgi:hypothetical protein
MFKRLVAIFLIVTASVAIDDRFFDKSHVPITPAPAPAPSSDEVAGAMVMPLHALDAREQLESTSIKS